ncbi:tannase and feruloyl esterase [Colletotrichum cereale]|nr:tannase and feruloyl esterase [Colletotrichum cereale]
MVLGAFAHLFSLHSDGAGLQKPIGQLNSVVNDVGPFGTPIPCVSESFPKLVLPGAEIRSLEASLITNYSGWIPSGWRFSQPSVDIHNASFCNVTVSYTHPGHDDIVNVEAWLPTEEWNGKLQAVGGGGWRAGRFILSYAGMAGAVADGYATVTTDAGLGNAAGPEPWALISPGNSNFYALNDLGSQTLNDEATIAKQLIKSYYGRGPTYSYWNGCSQGGRQGAMLAQRYPTAYDGIIAAAPAVNWAGVFISTMWPKVYMDVTGQYPQACELEELTHLAIYTCDGLDGVRDGIIADTNSCKRIFDPFKYVGRRFYCPSLGKYTSLSLAAAAVANAMWTGPVAAENESSYLHGFEIGTDLTRGATTSCDQNGQCTGVPNIAVKLLMGYFIGKHPDSSTTKISFKELERAYHSFRQQYDSFLGSDDPDLTSFRDAGGKMITFHGLADPVIPTNISLGYYQEVLALQPDAPDFYRYFLVPGLGHCWGGRGGQPVALFDQLRLWVENGTVPESSPVTITKPDNTQDDQIVCPYPKKAVFHDAALTSPSGWSCT